MLPVWRENNILYFYTFSLRPATTEVRSRPGQNEELWSIGVSSLVRHRENTGLLMLQLKVLVRKIAASIIDWLAAGSLQSEHVSTLDEEAGHNTVETGELVTVALISPAENPSRGQSTDLFLIIKSFSFWLKLLCIYITKIKIWFFLKFSEVFGTISDLSSMTIVPIKEFPCFRMK